jgi:hypothetical protein
MLSEYDFSRRTDETSRYAEHGKTNPQQADVPQSDHIAITIHMGLSLCHSATFIEQQRLTRGGRRNLTAARSAEHVLDSISYDNLITNDCPHHCNCTRPSLTDGPQVLRALHVGFLQRAHEGGISRTIIARSATFRRTGASLCVL